MKKVLVTGAGGFVGARILDQWRGMFDLCTFPHGFLAGADEASVRRFIAREKPDVIVHTAALSDTRDCEADPDASYRANVLLPEWVAKEAAEEQAKLLAFSSDQVYTGIRTEGPLPETTPLSPSNVYGRHKLEAEQRVLLQDPDAVLLRASWMYDLPGYRLPLRGNLPLNLIRAERNREDVAFSRNDHRGISYVREVIENLIPAMELPGGVYNFGSENNENMWETSLIFAELMGVVLLIQPESWHRNLCMDLQKLNSFGIRFASTEDAFRKCLKDYQIDHVFGRPDF